MFLWLRQLRSQSTDLYALGAFLLIFILFFWPSTLDGRFLVTNDALLYSYPLRTLAWQMIRNGELPLWTPNILSGYPLLSMAQLALLYPLTWGYVFLSAHAAEQIYILAPYLLAPMFLYAYLRKLDCSPVASFLAGLSFTYGGLMFSPLGEAGMYTNAVLWLPLVLLALENSRTQSFARSLGLATAAYSLSVFTGIGQGFLYVGILALAYALMLCVFVPAAQRRWKPLLIAVLALTFAGSFSAWQILETLQAQRSSIRRTLDYVTFSGDAFSLPMLVKLLLNPVPYFINQYNLFSNECTPYVALLPLGFAWCALARWRQPRVTFWLIVALLGFLFMLGNATPLYRVLYVIPVVNLFRNAWRHAFEWTLAVSILAAFGFDWLSARWQINTKSTKAKIVSIALCAANLLGTVLLWRATTQPTANSRQVVTLIETAPVIWPDGLSPLSLLIAKLCLAVLACVTLWWTWRAFSGKARAVMVVLTIAVACLWEQALIVNHWWFPQAKPAAFYTTVSPASRWLQQFNPSEQRIYTTMIPGFQLDLRRAEAQDFSARRGLHDAAGYEPLMPARYNDVFGPGWYFATPELAAPRDPQVVKPVFKGFDLLNVRYSEWFAASLPSSIRRGDVRFAAQDTGVVVMPGQTQTLYAHALAANRLSLVSLLVNAAARRTGEPFARLRLIRADGSALERTLQIGIDSADFSFGKAEARDKIQHQPAQFFDVLPGNDAHRFWTQQAFDTTIIDRLEIENLTDEVTIYLTRASLYDEAKPAVQALAPRLPDWRKVYDYDGAQIYENPRVMPRVWLTDQIRNVTAAEALRAIRGESAFDPRAETLLESATSLALTERFKQAPQARITKYTANRIIVETEADAPALLTLSERYTPGWRATLDGQATRIYLANYLLRGVYVPAGKHRIEMHYAAPAAWRGLWFSLIAGLIFVAVVATPWVRIASGVRSRQQTP